jgi:vitamin B12 transporter
LIENKTESVNAVFAQISNSDVLMEDTTLALGVRYNRLGNANDTIWNLSGQHQLTDTLYLRGAVGTAFRLPDAEELYLKDCCEVGNPNLEPEESFNINVGVGGATALSGGTQWSWTVDVFHREIDNLISVDYDQPAFPDGIFMNMNDSVESQGLQLTSSFAFNNGWALSLDYTRTDANGRNSSDQIQDIPEDAFKAAMTYRPDTLPLELKLSVMMVGDVYDEVGGVGRQEHGNYTVADLGGAWFLGDQEQHRLGFRFENMFDEEYDTFLSRGTNDVDGSFYAYGFSGTPRTFHVNYTFRY